MHARPVWLFMAATAMATTVSTLAATAMVKAESSEPIAVVCSCETPPAPAPAVVEAPTPTPTEIAEPVAPPAEAEPVQTERVPIARQAKATVEGPLDKDIIRRIVRAHINEVRYCYNEGLAEDPALAGRVVVAFTIGPKGSVTNSEVTSTDLADEGVAECISEAVARWKFPKSKGGEPVQVTYPFVLEPG